MAAIVKSAMSFYNYWFVTLKGLIFIFHIPSLEINILMPNTDPRSENYFLLGESPAPMLMILACYAALCTLGPKLMQSRRPFELKSLMIVYNLVQVVGCAVFWIFVRLKSFKWTKIKQELFFLGRLSSVEEQIQFRLSKDWSQRINSRNDGTKTLLHLFPVQDCGSLRYCKF